MFDSLPSNGEKFTILHLTQVLYSHAFKDASIILQVLIKVAIYIENQQTKQVKDDITHLFLHLVFLPQNMGLQRCMLYNPLS